jgi:hypothetical protein
MSLITSTIRELWIKQLKKKNQLFISWQSAKEINEVVLKEFLKDFTVIEIKEGLIVKK